MNNTTAFFIITLLLFPLLYTPLSTTNTLSEQTNTAAQLTTATSILYVDDDNTQGPWNGTLEHPYRYIHHAVQNATKNTTIYVFNGKYQEAIYINTPLRIVGENQTHTIIDGNYQETIIDINAPQVTIENFTIRNSAGTLHSSAIENTDIPHTTIRNCLFYRTKIGIILANAENNTIIGCTFHTNEVGILLVSCKNTSIQRSLFTHNAIGIKLSGSSSITIQECYIHINGIGCFLQSCTTVTFLTCAIFNNNDNQGGLFFDACCQIDIQNCIFNHNGFGIRMFTCFNITIDHCDFHGNTHFAIMIAQLSEHITIINCIITEGFLFGIYCEHSSCTITHNNIYHSMLGLLLLDYSQGNARKNWWGSLLGPTPFEENKRERVLAGKQSRIHIIPWLLKPVENAGANWQLNPEHYEISINLSEFMSIELPGVDSDGDHAPDWWENKWGYNPNKGENHYYLDPDEDGLNNIQECYMDTAGSNPFKKDVFFEFDWVIATNENYTNRPPCDLIYEITQNFAAHNITLHVDTGNLGGGEEIPYISNFSYAQLDDLYWQYFLHNDINNPRKGIFRYCLICDVGPWNGFSFIGWDHLDAMCLSADKLQENNLMMPRGRLIIGGALHELGHTFGLFIDDFAGIDNQVAIKIPLSKQALRYRMYLSCLNYQYTYLILGYSDGSRPFNDFNDWDNLDFSFFKTTQFNWPK